MSVRVWVRAASVAALGVGAGCNALTGADALTVCTACGDGPATASSSGTTASSSGTTASSSGTTASSSGTTASSSGTAASSSSSSSSSSGNVACPKPETGLLAYYPLDEMPGATTVRDCSGNGHDGTVISPGTWGAGKFGGAFVTSASAGCIDLGTPEALLLEDASFTVAAWVNAQAFGTATLSYYIIGRTALPQSAGWRVGTDPTAMWTGKVFDKGQNGLVIVGSPDGQPLETWTHVAATYAPGGQMTLYVNGQAVSSASYSSILPDSSATIRIGCRGDGQGIFHGSIDEVRLYSGAADANAIAALAVRMP